VAVRTSPSNEGSGLGEVETTPRPPRSYQVAWRLDDGSQGSKSFATTVDDVDPNIEVCLTL
jgi:hypothetical protein